MSLRRTTSTLSSEFLLCLFLKNRINSQQSLCQRALLWSDTLCYLSILFYFCIFEMFLKIYRKLKRKKKKTTIESSWQRSTELLLEKQLLLALSLSGGCGRRGQNTENRGLAVRATPQRPGRPPASHRTPSPLCALPSPQVFICENTHLTSLGGILGQLNELQQRRVLWNHRKNKGFPSLLLLEVLVRDLLYS